jgi:hypothetical protein
LLGPYFSYLPFTRAWFPQDRFDEVRQANGWTLGRKGNGYVALWSEQGLVWTAPGHTDRVSALTFVGDGIVSASWDASVRRWALDPLASAR